MFFINYVQERREELGLTRERLAELVGVSVTTIRNIENTDKDVKTNILTCYLLAHYLQTPLLELFQWTDTRKPRPKPVPVNGSEPCNLYIFEDATGGVIKVGISNNVTSRLATVESSSGRKLSLVYTQKYPSRELARAEESRLHNLLTEYRLPGEWFKITYEEFSNLPH